VRTFYEGPLRVGVDFTSGPIPNSPFEFVRRTAETPMVVHIKGRAFLPSPKGRGFTRAYR